MYGKSHLDKKTLMRNRNVIVLLILVCGYAAPPSFNGKNRTLNTKFMLGLRLVDADPYNEKSDTCHKLKTLFGATGVNLLLVSS